MKELIQAPARIDTRNCSVFEGEVRKKLDTGCEELTIDFAETNYISSVGLRVLLVAQKAMNARNGMLLISHVGSNVMDVFEVTGYSGILTFAED